MNMPACRQAGPPAAFGGIRAVDKAVRRSAGAFVAPVLFINEKKLVKSGATPGPSGLSGMARGGDARRVRSLIAHSRGSTATKPCCV